ncbi:MAG: hypothetical protein BroJett018_52050 [Chloroflexota bacterium]|nr:MAG: hypothetical protein BroJett018_52050 [Chloroflexota bacterium]
MTAIDACEPQIIRALEKDGWQIFKKPHRIRLRRRSIYADFSARLVNEDGEFYIIVLEVKCLSNPKTDLEEIYAALGQYQIYRASMDSIGETYPLFLAMPNEAYQRLALEPSIMLALDKGDVKLVIVDMVEEVVVLWERWPKS